MGDLREPTFLKGPQPLGDGTQKLKSWSFQTVFQADPLRNPPSSSEYLLLILSEGDEVL